LIKVHKLDKAEEVYKNMPQHASCDSDRAICYHQLGCIQDDAGKFSTTLLFYQKALVIRGVAVPLNRKDLASSYNNIGLVYFQMGENAKVLSSYEKSLVVQRTAHKSN
jgi:tetratricopeptide (TPR) repeat protein